MSKAPEAFRTISEVAAELDLPQHVLRFWESRFSHIKPLKRGGGRRYYRREDVDLLRGIRRLLYGEGYTIAGVKKILQEQGVRTVQLAGQGRGTGLALALPAHEEQQIGPTPTVPALLIPQLKSDGEDAPVQDPDLPTGKESKDRDALPVEAPRSFENSTSPQATPPEVAAAAAPPDSSPAEFGRLNPAEIDRLRGALAALEACRRLLVDKNGRERFGNAGP